MHPLASSALQQSPLPGQLAGLLLSACWDSEFNFPEWYQVPSTKHLCVPFDRKEGDSAWTCWTQYVLDPLAVLCHLTPATTLWRERAYPHWGGYSLLESTWRGCPTACLGAALNPTLSSSQPQWRADQRAPVDLLLLRRLAFHFLSLKCTQFCSSVFSFL